ncbi:MAG: hypothetical protein V4695_07265 [Pseudomonadota bacterium]
MFLKVIAVDYASAFERAQHFAQNCDFDLADVAFIDALPIGCADIKIHAPSNQAAYSPRLALVPA